MLKKIFWLLGGLWLALMLAGCGGDSALQTEVAAAASLPPALTTTVTPRPASEQIDSTIPTLSPTASQTLVFTPPPGENLNLLIFDPALGQIVNYSLKTWAEAPAEGLKKGVRGDLVAFSPDGQWMVFFDQEGAKILPYPFTGIPRLIPGIRENPGYEGMSFNFSPDSSLLVMATENGYKLWRSPFTEQPALVVPCACQDDVDAEIAWYHGIHEVKFSPDGRSFLYGLSDGIYLFDLEQNASSRLVSAKNFTYAPIGWSPDGQWAEIGIPRGYWPVDVVGVVFVHVPSKRVYTFDCQLSGDWSKDGAMIPFHDYHKTTYGCDDDPQMSFHAFDDGNVIEKTVYQDMDSQQAGFSHAFGNITWDAESWKFYFSEFVEMDDRIETRLLVFDRKTGQIRTLVVLKGKINWKADVKKGMLYYLAETEDSQMLMGLNFDTEKIEPLFPVPPLCSVEVIPDTDWLLGKTCDQQGYLVNAVTGSVIPLLFNVFDVMHVFSMP